MMLINAEGKIIIRDTIILHVDLVSSALAAQNSFSIGRSDQSAL